MRIIKKFAYAAVAVACAAGIAGCDQKTKEYAGPKVAEGAVVALAGRKADATSLAPLVKQYKLDGVISPEKMEQLPDKVKDLVKELEIDKLDVKWTAASVGDLSVVAKDAVPEIGIAMAVTLDLDKFVAAVDKKCKEEKEDVSFNKTTISGVQAYEIVSKKNKGVVPCVASLDGKLVLFASSADGLAKQIALYRDGKGESKDFGAFALGANDLIRVKAVKVGENVKKSIPDQKMLEGLKDLLPDGDKLVLGLGSVDLALSASADGKDVKLDLAVETASDADATKLATLVQSSMAPLTMMVKDAKDDGMKLAAGVLKSVKVEGKGKVASLSAACPADDLIKFVSEQKKNLIK